MTDVVKTRIANDILRRSPEEESEITYIEFPITFMFQCMADRPGKLSIVRRSKIPLVLLAILTIFEIPHGEKDLDLSCGLTVYGTLCNASLGNRSFTLFLSR